jgi:hypothetical protein
MGDAHFGAGNYEGTQGRWERPQLNHPEAAPTFPSGAVAASSKRLSSPQKEKTTMNAFWHWLKDWWAKDQAFKPRTTMHRPQGSTPIVGIAEDAYWRLLIEGRR